MDHRWKMIAATAMLALPLAGCLGFAQQDSWPVGTCVLVDDGGTAAVACAEPHTHKVIAIVGKAEDCPSEADMFAQPADPDDGLTTTCFQSDRARP